MGTPVMFNLASDKPWLSVKHKSEVTGSRERRYEGEALSVNVRCLASFVLWPGLATSKETLEKRPDLSVPNSALKEKVQLPLIENKKAVFVQCIHVNYRLYEMSDNYGSTKV